MKKQFKHFTLVEMLAVIAIIGILAALVIPAVIISRQRGQITQAKSDISSITTALKQLKSDYNRIMVKSGSNYCIGNITVYMHILTYFQKYTGNPRILTDGLILFIGYFIVFNNPL